MTRQEQIWDNKIKHNFNITNTYSDIRRMISEVVELMEAVEHKDKDNIGEELSDIIIYCYGLATMNNINNLDKVIDEKINKNKNRHYNIDKNGEAIEVK